MKKEIQAVHDAAHHYYGLKKDVPTLERFSALGVWGRVLMQAIAMLLLMEPPTDPAGEWDFLGGQLQRWFAEYKKMVEELTVEKEYQAMGRLAVQAEALIKAEHSYKSSRGMCGCC